MSPTESHRSARSASRERSASGARPARGGRSAGSAEARADGLADRQLERQGRRLGHSATWFLALALVLAVPGLVLVVVGSSTPVIGLGAALLLLGALPGVVAMALLGSGAVARWSARRKPFA